MKTLPVMIFLMILASGCSECDTNTHRSNGGTIIYKIHKKNREQDTDTLWVSQNDTAVFKAEKGMQRNSAQKAEWVTRYELRNPIDEAYYFIYNDANQLVKEGKYTARYVYEDKTIEEGNLNETRIYTSFDVYHTVKVGE